MTDLITIPCQAKNAARQADIPDYITMSPEEFVQIVAENRPPRQVGVKRKLTKDQVFDILGSNLTNVQAADKYGVTDSAIIQIRKGKNYSDYYSEFKKIV